MLHHIFHKRQRFTALILLVFCVFYCLESLVNHYLFRTHAYDLGMFNHALYNYSHFQHNYFTIDMNGAEPNYLGDHFAPLTMLLSPLSYLFGSYTLLLVQIFSILFGGYGIFRYAKLKGLDTLSSNALMAYFLSIWGIYSALAFDFHTNVVAAMLVPWLAYFYKLNKKGAFLVFFVLILIAKENMSLWLFFIMIGLMLSEKKSWRDRLKFEIPLMLFTVVYFYVVISILMPYFRGGEGFDQMSRYSHYGDTLPEIIKYIITHPFEFIAAFFVDTLPNSNMNNIKMEVHRMVIFSAGFLMLLRPRYLIMLIPIYAQKFLSNNWITWTISFQYSIEFVPIMALAAVDVAASIDKVKLRRILSLSVFVLAATTTVVSFWNRKKVAYDGYGMQCTIFFTPPHFETHLDISAVNKALKLIPDDAVVSTSAVMAPHIALRERIYSFPIIKDDVDYIAVFKDRTNTAPLGYEDYIKKIKQLRASGKYEVVHDADNVLILKDKDYKRGE